MHCPFYGAALGDEEGVECRIRQQSQKRRQLYALIKNTMVIVFTLVAGGRRSDLLWIFSRQKLCLPARLFPLYTRTGVLYSVTRLARSMPAGRSTRTRTYTHTHTPLYERTLRLRASNHFLLLFLFLLPPIGGPPYPRGGRPRRGPHSHQPAIPRSERRPREAAGGAGGHRDGHGLHP